MSKTYRHTDDELPIEPAEPVTVDDRRLNDPQHDDAPDGEQKRR